MTVDRQHAASALVQLRRRVDAHFEAAVERSPTQFSCRAGCHECCRRGLSVFAIEAVRIENALEQLPDGARAQVRAQAMRPDEALCPLLLDGLCSVYDERPIICRSHGL
ncbi:MAG: YkgJ family cysteine cluster protein, partial [Nannocystaceae bacterium]|nr:YkgJ family cysteine cluster protein [Nannocystaceae bacterium]